MLVIKIKVLLTKISNKLYAYVKINKGRFDQRERERERERIKYNNKIPSHRYLHISFGMDHGGKMKLPN